MKRLPAFHGDVDQLDFLNILLFLLQIYPFIKFKFQPIINNQSNQPNRVHAYIVLAWPLCANNVVLTTYYVTFLAPF